MKIPYFYKYYPPSSTEQSCENITRLFINSELYFPSPSNFNDPFDCKIHTFCEASPERHEINLRKYLKNKYPLKTNLEIENHIEKEKQEGKFENANRFFKERFKIITENFQKNISVFCLSAKKDDILMWSHYTDGHRGFCVKFENDSEFFGKAKSVSYKGEYPYLNFPISSEEEINELSVRTKSNHWLYEKEWRIVEHSGAGFRKFPEYLLKGIILGCRIESQFENTIRSLLKTRKYEVKLFRAKEKERTFGLDIVQVT